MYSSVLLISFKQHLTEEWKSNYETNTVDPRYLDLGYLE